MTTLRTPFCDLVGITAPVVQAPIGGAANPALAAAVSEAGGLGMLALSWARPDALRSAIQATRQRTGRPFGVNLILHWEQAERVELCLAEDVRVISTFWGDPGPLHGLIADGGALHLHTVASAEEARRAVDAGVDVVVAQGWEAGGHVWGEVATLPLVPAVVDAVAPVPVVAAGGIADGRGLAAALALGADAAWLGTRFLLAEEAGTDPEYQRLVMAAAETGTSHGIVFDIGWPEAPHRALRNSTVRTWEAAGRPSPGRRPGEGDVLGRWTNGGDIPRYSDIAPVHGLTGNTEAMALYAGQGVGVVHRTKPAADIVAELCTDAERALNRFTR
jgi:NAD(P)H-dependent flavin oxidoreductase YrpB (nitropropane dioxygenase family)